MQEEENDITFDDVLNLIKSPDKSDRIIILNAEVISSSFMCFLNPKFQHTMFDATVFARRAKMNQLNNRNQI